MASLGEYPASHIPSLESASAGKTSAISGPAARRIFVQSGAWFILIENVGGMLSSGGAERVYRDLHRLGCEVEGSLFRASEVGLPHERERLFILAVANDALRRRRGLGGNGSADRPARSRIEDVVAAWPTPAARDFKGVDRTEIDRGNARPLNEVVAHWPTPTSLSFSDSHQPGNSRSYNKTMEMASAIWSTPRASDGEKGGPNQSFGAGGVPLPAQTAAWPTPTSMDSVRMPAPHFTTPNITLNHAITKWSTPSVADVTGGHSSRSGARKSEPLLNGQAKALFAPQDQETAKRGPSSPNSLLSAYLRYRATTDSALRSERRSLLRMAIRRSPIGWTRKAPTAFVRPSFRKSLNPLFVGDLMGWPPGLTSFACSETASRTHKARWRSELSLMVSHVAPPAQLSLFG